MAVKGRLKDMGLSDILQLLHTEKRTVAIHLGSELGYGRVFLKDGEIVHASYRGLIGKDALLNLLSWKEGEFDVETGELSQEETIKEAFEHLMWEGLKRKGEPGIAEKRPEVMPYKDRESMAIINTLIEAGILERIR